jgi:hypothetical protein
MIARAAPGARLPFQYGWVLPEFAALICPGKLFWLLAAGLVVLALGFLVSLRWLAPGAAVGQGQPAIGRAMRPEGVFRSGFHFRRTRPPR